MQIDYVDHGFLNLELLFIPKDKEYASHVTFTLKALRRGVRYHRPRIPTYASHHMKNVNSDSPDASDLCLLMRAVLMMVVSQVPIIDFILVPGGVRLCGIFCSDSFPSSILLFILFFCIIFEAAYNKRFLYTLFLYDRFWLSKWLLRWLRLDYIYRPVGISVDSFHHYTHRT